MGELFRDRAANLRIRDISFFSFLLHIFDFGAVARAIRLQRILHYCLGCSNFVSGAYPLAQLVVPLEFMRYRIPLVSMQLLLVALLIFSLSFFSSIFHSRTGADSWSERVGIVRSSRFSCNFLLRLFLLRLASVRLGLYW